MEATEAPLVQKSWRKERIAQDFTLLKTFMKYLFL